MKLFGLIFMAFWENYKSMLYEFVFCNIDNDPYQIKIPLSPKSLQVLLNFVNICLLMIISSSSVQVYPN